MNIEADLTDEILSIFARNGIRYRSKSFRNTLIDFLSYNRKFISHKCRNIHISDLIKDKIRSYSKATEFLSIIFDAEQGKDLNKYQSNSFNQLRHHDYLLNIWNIHHLHLTSELGAKGKKKLSDELVFALVKSNDIYFLDFDKHEQEIFGNEKWLAIIHNNWPQLIEQFKGDELFMNPAKISSIERQTFWEKGYSLNITNVNGIGYIDPGVGITISGHSMLVVAKANNIHRWIWEIENWYKENENFLKGELLQNNLQSEDIELKARIRNAIEIYDNSTGEVLFSYA